MSFCSWAGIMCTNGRVTTMCADPVALAAFHTFSLVGERIAVAAANFRSPPAAARAERCKDRGLQATFQMSWETCLS